MPKLNVFPSSLPKIPPIGCNMGPLTNKRKVDDISKDKDGQAHKKDDVVQVAEEVAAAAAAAAGDADGEADADADVEPDGDVDVDADAEADMDTPMPDGEDVTGDDDKDDDDGVGSASKRRFFPRVKHLLTAEWEPFLLGVLDALEESGASKSAAASHKLTNSWYKAFHIIYNGVARDCSIPHGKNRYHKFKDKIVELWQAIEAYNGGDLPLRDRALAQLDDYRQACAAQAVTPKKESSIAGVGPAKTPTMSRPKPQLNRSLATERQSVVESRWQHLDEAVALKSLPDSLQKLINIRNLVVEVGFGNKVAVDEQYDKALQDYLKILPEATDALYEKILGLAFLMRHAHGSKEKQDIGDVYERVVADFLMASNVTMATV